ncbi:delta-aminolevulinic acid dehydratase [Brevibacterium sp. HMSC08F02]|uniref:Delta-aminolevulinic acid dehydratase n=1 Tax=Brevibacterium ravenspurgense TaxID=479117 RepID=A0A150H8V0_9MICO|nr:MULTISPECIES: porphobilinogen synthase [Brevibacterium]KXZ58533.1 Delta-aminolevulinic acid dehydratase [Brevibacterium ravenspurgense]OFT27260.1 delta-aminolevulinic acid dehydratase [Brevibacterium sp. HMSC08F02]
MSDRSLPIGAVRPRRLRQSAAMRRLTSETKLQPEDLIEVLFVKEGLEAPVELTSMPGVRQHTLDSLVEAAERAVEAGVGGIMLFGIPLEYDERGSQADDPNGILNVAVRRVKDAVGDRTVVMTDLCLDEFTSHGHCGVLDEHGDVDNDATLERYASIAVAQARAGSDVLGLSGMMDGQVGAVREALDEAGFTNTVIMAYTAKYASAFYGPFREAVDSQLSGDRRTYQQDPANAREALHELQLDLAEGADIVMVKPGLPYLDILKDVAEASPVPVWSYQISGEYAMLEFASAAGAIDRKPAVLESLLAFKRAGADAVMTYYATQAAEWLNEQ